MALAARVNVRGKHFAAFSGGMPPSHRGEIMCLLGWASKYGRCRFVFMLCVGSVFVPSKQSVWRRLCLIPAYRCSCACRVGGYHQ